MSDTNIAFTPAEYDELKFELTGARTNYADSAETPDLDPEHRLVWLAAIDGLEAALEARRCTPKQAEMMAIIVFDNDVLDEALHESLLGKLNAIGGSVRH